MTDLAARYARAERLLPHRLDVLVRGGAVRPGFLDGTDRFWFRSASGDVLLADPDTRTLEPLLDGRRLAASLAELTGRVDVPEQLSLARVRPGRDVVRVDVGSDVVEVDLPSYACRVVGVAPGVHERVSPDGSRAAFVRDHDLWVRDLRTGAERQLTTDGAADLSYGTPPQSNDYRSVLDLLGLRHPPLVRWAPDSRRLVTQRLDERAVRTMHLVRSSPADGGPPRVHPLRYALPGDEHLPVGEVVVLDVVTGAAVTAAGGPRLMPWVTPANDGQGWWAAGRYLFLDADRDETTVSLCSLDPDTGAVEVLITETGSSRVALGPDLLPPAARGLSSGEVLWWSERSGWGHLYLYAADGTLVRQLTSGPWVVRAVVAVDEAARTVVLAAAGRDSGRYVRQLYRLHLDTAELVRITADELDHAAVGSPTGRCVVDVASSVDRPARSRVLDPSGRVLLELETADASALLAAGYEPPEPFVVTAADGVTELHGVLHRPAGLDPTRRYPVLDEIYPGPAHAPVPVRFPGPGGRTPFCSQPSFAALGFAVVTLNNRGTPLWSRDFRDHTRGDGYDDLLADHVAALRQLAERHPWLDLERVGIYGTSGGGHASTRALLLHPEVFSAAVSAAGSHDERVYHAMWAERFVGSPGSTDYAAKDNASLVDRLVGKLLLVHGEMDDNVLPHQTMRLVDALMRADKDVDLLIVPNADHDLGVHRHHWWRRRWDHFVRHLLGVEPPPYRLAPIPVDVATALRRIGAD